ncbi:hypothetical protein [Demetria terragena]|uniref:hypothetical protein n=1 Tax=Demetria terragena TaxID=63959 RepID=UPI0003818B5A|nr:hypothetical protein [Demetria terragena]
MRSSKSLSLAAAVAIGATGMGTSSALAAPSVDLSGPGSSYGKPIDLKQAANVKQAKEAKKIYQRILTKLPKDYRAKLKAFNAKAGIEHQPQQQMAITKIQNRGRAALAGKRVINPEDYECGPTPFNDWIDKELAPIESTTLTYLEDLGALEVPTYDALLFGAPDDGDHDLPAAEGPRLASSFETIQGFWDVPLDDIQLMSMDRNIFTKQSNMARTLKVLFKVGDADATSIAKDIQSLVKSDPALKGGKHALFSLNAFAYTGPDSADKVIFGDGILESLNETGHGAVGPDVVMSHEMAHHVQFENGTGANVPPSPEATRATELGADAFGNYAGAHSKGLGASASDLTTYQNVAFNIGDCGFESEEHHGTPNQRKAASSWGAAEVQNQDDPTAIQPSQTLQDRFEAALPGLTAPDAKTTIAGYLKKAKAAS